MHSNLQLLAIARHVYLVHPESGAYKQYNGSDWSSTTAAALLPSTQRIYVTTSFNNLWEITLETGEVRKISWDGWGTCNVLVTVSLPSDQLFAFCHKLWFVDNPETGHVTDFLGGYMDIWTRVNAAATVGQKIYATTSANNLWCIDTAEKTVVKLGGGSDNWSTCRALVEVKGRLIAFCYGLYEVDLETGKAIPFFDRSADADEVGPDDDDGGASKMMWNNVKCAAVIGTDVYVVAGSKLIKLDTIEKKVREVGDNWGSTKALIAVDRNLVGEI